MPDANIGRFANALASDARARVRVQGGSLTEDCTLVLIVAMYPSKPNPQEVASTSSIAERGVRQARVRRVTQAGSLFSDPSTSTQMEANV